MKEFLNKTMNQHRSAKSVETQHFAEQFARTCQVVTAALGDKPFNINGRINASALDSVMGLLLTQLENIPDDLGARYASLIADPEFLDTLSVSTSDTAVVRRRIAAVRKHLLV